MRIRAAWFILLYCPGLLFAQNGSWWEPVFPVAGDTITIFFDPAQNDEIPDHVSSLVLHWGINETGTGNWQTPPVRLWPPGTFLHADGVAARSPMSRDGTVWRIEVPTDTTVFTFHYVVNSGTPSSPGAHWGHNTDGANWNLTVFQSNVTAIVLEPQVDTRFGNMRRSPVFAQLQDTVKVVATTVTVNSQIATLALFQDGNEAVRVSSDTLTYDFVAAQTGTGFSTLAVVAEDTAGRTDTTSFAILVRPEVREAPRPGGAQDGVTVIDNSSVTLSLFAPFKQFVYVIGDFNYWMVDSSFYMNRHIIRDDSVHYWLTIPGLDADTEYAFQYLVDGKIRIADPYTTLILTPSDDRAIDDSLFPSLKAYPDGKTTHDVSVFKINRAQYQWQIPHFQRPAKEELVIYELLLRDFLAAHDYATLIDTLDYLERLGINAIELMPVNEFEGNESWGYNPAFYFAPDKFYGPAQDLKRFVDECHRRGIAVILDAVLNHSFGQHSLVRLYASGKFGPPTPENPWYNVRAKHPFNVGWDFNHESLNTQAFVDRVNAYWLTEFNVDGFRFDLSKGFTQRNSGNNVGLWSSFDGSRIALLQRMADRIWQVDSTAYVILEHFADNEEEKVLSNHGMLLWGNMNVAYSQSAMGWLSDRSRSSDLSWGYYKTRGWSKPHLISYMESHDEPWLMYKNLRFGRASANGSYNIKEVSTALERIKLVATFFLTLPGPKMLWQFGELGYDQKLPERGPQRTAPKPILWDYYQNEDRRRLYKFIAELLKLRQEHAVFRSPDSFLFMRVGQNQSDRIIRLEHTSVNVMIVGNFDVEPQTITPSFPHGGMWYDYFSIDSLDVTGSFAGISMKAGEFHLYTDKNIGFPDEVLVTSVAERSGLLPERFELFRNYPNPFNPETTIRFDLPAFFHVVIQIHNVLGQKVRTLLDKGMPAGRYHIQWNGNDDSGHNVASGIYILRMVSGGFVQSIKLAKLK
ncbi:MAG: alpha-amylase family glycosyl hydrolase [bacterium]